MDWKSTYGYVLIIWQCETSWDRKKHNVIRETTKCACEVVCIQRILWNLMTGQTKPRVLFSDNECVLKLAKKQNFHDCNKEIYVHFNFIRLLV